MATLTRNEKVLLEGIRPSVSRDQGEFHVLPDDVDQVRNLVGELCTLIPEYGDPMQIKITSVQSSYKSRQPGWSTAVKFEVPSERLAEKRIGFPIGR